MAHQRNIILIVGGMGPAAGASLHNRLIEGAFASGDKEHHSIVHLSFSSIPDRTEYLLTGCGTNPAEAAAAVAMSAIDAYLVHADQIDVVVPCVTFHAPPIWNTFSSRLSHYGDRVRLINLVEVTLERSVFKGDELVTAVSTKGTEAAGIWRFAAKRRNLEYYYIDPTMAEDIHNLIYNPLHGLKAHPYGSTECCRALREILRRLVSAGVTVIILGCTEFSTLNQQKPIAEMCEIAAKVIDPYDFICSALQDASMAECRSTLLPLTG